MIKVIYVNKEGKEHHADGVMTPRGIAALVNDAVRIQVTVGDDYVIRAELDREAMPYDWYVSDNVTEEEAVSPETVQHMLEQEFANSLFRALNGEYTHDQVEHAE